MKTLIKKFEMKNMFFLFMLTYTLGLISFYEVRSQDNSTKDHDYLMPGKSKSMVLLNSGIPYVAIGEYSFGLTERFSMGVLYGYTPIALGYGMRIKSIVAQPTNAMRVYLKVPMIYYPNAKNLGDDPWVLTWPTLNVEWKLRNGTRIWTGAGVIGASCLNALLGIKEDEEDGAMEKKGIMSDLWNTIQIGCSKPISNKFSWMLEVAPVFNGLKLAGEDWIGGPPLVLNLGVSYTL